ncbi:MAG: 50S ribosomal protein L11 [Candidatus Aenigmatarchaeota archaeon]
MITIKALVEGGKATPTPPLGPSLAPTKVNISQVIATINEKTKDFAGMQVPVTIKIDPVTKEFEISVGTPSVAALIKKELKVQKLSKAPFKVFEKDGVKEEFKESLPFEKVVKIAKMKLDDLKVDDLKKAVKQVVASCVSFGVYVEEKTPKEILKEVDEGKWDEKLKN